MKTLKHWQSPWHTAYTPTATSVLSTHTLSRPSNRYWSRPSNGCWISCCFSYLFRWVKLRPSAAKTLRVSCWVWALSQPGAGIAVQVVAGCSRPLELLHSGSVVKMGRFLHHDICDTHFMSHDQPTCLSAAALRQVWATDEHDVMWWNLISLLQPHNAPTALCKKYHRHKNNFIFNS